jgi:hypothetical protein
MLSTHTERHVPGLVWNKVRYSAYAPIYDVVASPFAAGAAAHALSSSRMSIATALRRIPGSSAANSL